MAKAAHEANRIPIGNRRLAYVDDTLARTGFVRFPASRVLVRE